MIRIASYYTMLAFWFQAYGLKDSDMSLLGRKGPISVRKPNRPEQPGPPLVQKASGSVAGLLIDSTFQKIVTANNINNNNKNNNNDKKIIILRINNNIYRWQ